MAYINKIKVSNTDYDVLDANLYNSNGDSSVFVDYGSTVGDKQGSTVLQSTNKNVNLNSAKNIQLKSKKGKVIFDTTYSILENGDNEIQLISKVKEDVVYGTGSNAEHYKTETTSYKGDHSNMLIEAGRVRIKPYNVPEWTASDTTVTNVTAKNKIDAEDMRDGYLFLDTGGMEEASYGGTAATSADNESKFYIKVGNNSIDDGNITTGKYRPLVIQSRGIDFRQMSHGGIALQPCGYDNPSANSHHENKIKFESSRIEDIETGIENDGSITTTNGTAAYQASGKWVKGGDGLEFGTFNNLHTSLYTGDYRFKGDADVYGVTRLVEYRDAQYKVYFTKYTDATHSNIAYRSSKKMSYSGSTKKFTEDNGGDYLYADSTRHALNSTGQYLKYDTSNTPSVVEAATGATVFGVWNKADYITQADDFKDILNNNATHTTWQDIINAGNAFEDGKIKLYDRNSVNVKYEVSKKGNVTGSFTTIGYSVKNNLPSTYSEVTTNGGTISESDYNTLKTFVDSTGIPNNNTSIEKSVSIKDLVDLVYWMKENNKGPWESAS